MAKVGIGTNSGEIIVVYMGGEGILQFLIFVVVVVAVERKVEGDDGRDVRNAVVTSPSPTLPPLVTQREVQPLLRRWSNALAIAYIFFMFTRGRCDVGIPPNK